MPIPADNGLQWEQIRIMRVWRWLAVALGCSACAVLPRTETSITPVSKEAMPWRAGPAGNQVLELESSAGIVRMRVSRWRACSRVTYEIRDVTHERKAYLAVANGGGSDGEFALWLLLVPIVLPISAVITAIILSGEKPHTRREAKLIDVAHDECPLFGAGTPLAVRFPSGTTVQLTTDGSGQASVAIPDGEPDAGIVSITGVAAPRTLRYDRHAAAPIVDTDSCRARRSAAMLMAQHIADDKARTKALRALPSCAP